MENAFLRATKVLSTLGKTGKSITFAAAMSKFKFHILYGVTCALSLLPLWLHYAMAWVLYLLLAHVIRYRQGVIDRNLRNSFPEKSERERRLIRRKYYRFLTDYVAETIKFATISRRNIMRRMTFSGGELVDEILGSGQSVQLVLGHYCNWEWIPSFKLWSHARADYAQIYKPLRDKALDQVFLKIRTHTGSQCVPMHDTLRHVIACRRQGIPSITGYIMDQVPKWENIHLWTQFLNQDTPVFSGWQRIAIKERQAVFFLDVHRVKRGYYHCDFKLITRNPAEMGEQALTDTVFGLLEKNIRKAPEFWLWSHNRWKRTREEFNRRFEVVNGHVVEKQHPDHA